MIEKITNQNQIARHKLAEKINKLVDAVNVLQAQVAILEEHAHPTATTKPTDLYAEQRRWIGKLCRFSQLCGCHQHIDILKRISESGLYVTDDGELHYAYCEPVKPDDDIIYKGE